jgi:hypothetical protein
MHVNDNNFVSNFRDIINSDHFELWLRLNEDGLIPQKMDGCAFQFLIPVSKIISTNDAIVEFPKNKNFMSMTNLFSVFHGFEDFNETKTNYGPNFKFEHRYRYDFSFRINIDKLSEAYPRLKSVSFEIVYSDSSGGQKPTQDYLFSSSDFRWADPSTFEKIPYPLNK